MDTAALVRNLVDRYNSMEPGDAGIDRVVELCHPDIAWREGPTGPNPDGRGGGFGALRAALAFEDALFREQRIDVDDVVVDGDRAALRYRWTATIAADLGAGAPSVGSRIEVENAMFVRVAMGLIIEYVAIRAEPLGIEEFSVAD